MTSLKVKSSRIGTILNNLHKFWTEFQEHDKQEPGPQFEPVKQACNKLQQLVLSQDKCCKELLSKHITSVDLLLEIFQFSCECDLQTTIYVADMLAQLTSVKGPNQLMDTGMMHIVSDSMVKSNVNLQSCKDALLMEDMWISYHRLLHKIILKDKRFGTTLRLSGVLELSLQLIKAYSTNYKVLLPLLQLMKCCVNSLPNVNMMLKRGLVDVLLKTMQACGQKRQKLMKTVLDLLNGLCKSKSGAKISTDHSVIPIAISLYQDWHRSDHRNRQVAMRRLLLNIVKLCTQYGFGRKSFASVDGFKALYFLGLEGIENKELDSVLRLIIAILRKCTNVNNKLPVNGLQCPLKFQLQPFSKEMKELVSAIEMVDDELDTGENEDLIALSEDDDNESDNEEDDESADGGLDDEEELTSKCTDPSINLVSNGELFNAKGNKVRVRVGDYKEFFKEFHELKGDYNVQLDLLNAGNEINDQLSEQNFLSKHYNSLASDSNISVRIPTAEPDNDNECYLENTNTDKNIKVLEVLDCESEDLCDRIRSFYIGTDENDAEVLCDNFGLIENRAQSNNIDSCDHFTVSRELKSNDRIYPSVESVGDFVKKPSPFLFGHLPPINPEYLVEKKPYLHRLMMFQDFARAVFPDKVVSRVVYDLDALLLNADETDANYKSNPCQRSSSSKNRSTPKISPVKRNGSSNVLNAAAKDEILKTSPLSFESRFESGNLRKAIQVRHYEYDLILNADVNTNHHHQWFFFQVEDMECGPEYRFNIINCEKVNSQFNFGMRPVFYSHHEAVSGNPGWERIGSRVCYYKNHYEKSMGNLKNYYTATFTVAFPYSNDTCYFAYHYPYTVTMLHSYFRQLENMILPTVYFRKEKLCETLTKNEVTLLTITGRSTVADVNKRPFVMVTSRVHPGESNSSWILKGLIDYLTGFEETANQLRSMYIFKIVPMLNPDGVINGCHRCSLSGNDLNRQWKNPDQRLHPSIYHAKNLILCMKEMKKTPTVLLDLHGHSRKKNVFMYGCPSLGANGGEMKICSDGNESMDDLPNDLCSESDTVKLLPGILGDTAPCFSLQNCKFAMEKSKESTARIVGYQELDIARCYTMESTYSGMDQGPYKGCHIGTRELEEMGRHVGLALLELSYSPNVRLYDENADLSSLGFT